MSPRRPAVERHSRNWLGRPVLPRLSRDPRSRGLLSSSGLMDTRPGLAPGKSWIANSRLACFGMRVFWKWRGVPVILRPRELHRLECCGYTTAPRLRSSARGELHSQGSPLLRRCGLLFPLNHTPNETRSRDRSCTGVVRFTRSVHGLPLPRGSWKWCAMPVLPRPDRFGRPSCELIHQSRLKMAAAPGVAPGPPWLQHGALLHELCSEMKNGPSARFRAAVCRLSAGCSPIELQREWSPVEVLRPRLPGVGRVRCCYANRRKLVRPRTRGRTRTG